MRKLLIMAPVAVALIGARQGNADRAQAAPLQLPTLVEVEPLSAPIIDAGRVTGTLTAELMFEAADGDSDALGESMPLLRAATRDALAEHARLHASPWRAVDAAELARAVESAGKQVSPALDRVLVTKVRALPA